MKKSILCTLSIVLSTILILGCGSTDSGESELTLEDIIPNSTWYMADYEEPNTYYFKFIFEEETYRGGSYDFPCGSEPIGSETIEFQILDDDRLSLDNRIFDVLSYSEDEFTIELTEDGYTYAVPFKKSCEEL